MTTITRRSRSRCPRIAKPSSRNRGDPMRILLLLIGAVLLLYPGEVRADGTAILIAGNAPPHERELSQSAMAASIQAQGGKVVQAPFTSKDAALVKKCLSNAAPWVCMQAAVAPKGV